MNPTTPPKQKNISSEKLAEQMRREFRRMDKPKGIKRFVASKVDGPNSMVAMGDRTPRHWEKQETNDASTHAQTKTQDAPKEGPRSKG